MENVATKSPEFELESALASSFELALRSASSKSQQTVRAFSEALETTSAFTNLVETMAQLARAPALKKRLSGEDRIALGAFFVSQAHILPYMLASGRPYPTQWIDYPPCSYKVRRP